MIQRILQGLAAVRQAQLEKCAVPMSGPGDMYAYEAGRRIGVMQGIALTTQAITTVLKDTDEKDKDL